MGRNRPKSRVKIHAPSSSTNLNKLHGNLVPIIVRFQDAEALFPNKLMNATDIYNNQKTQLFNEIVIIARRPFCRQLTTNKNNELNNESPYFLIAINWQAEFTGSTFSVYDKRIRRSPSTGLQRQQQQRQHQPTAVAAVGSAAAAPTTGSSVLP